MTVLYCTVLYFTVLYSSVLYYWIEPKLFIPVTNVVDTIGGLTAALLVYWDWCIVQ